MIELERIEDPIFEGRTWTDAANEHVIVHETERFYRGVNGEPGWYVRDVEGEHDRFDTFAQAFDYVNDPEVWGEVTLAPANRLRRDIAEGRADEVGHFLLEYLADFGAVGIDAQELAQQVFARVGNDEEAWR